MNKKKLSVVMAGAMLASSVAPVLAAETSELDTTQLGSLVETVEKKLTEERFDKNATANTGVNIKTATNNGLDDASTNIAGRSIYFVRIVKADGSLALDDMKAIYAATLKGEDLRGELQDAFQKLTADDVVEIWEVGSTKDDDGKIVSNVTATTIDKYSVADFNNTTKDAIYTELSKSSTNKLLKNDSKDSIVVGKNNITIHFATNVVLDNENFKKEYKVTDDGSKNYTLTLEVGNNKLDFGKYLATSKIAIDQNTNKSAVLASSTGLSDVHGFPQVAEDTKPNDIVGKLLESITIIGATGTNYKTEDIYDGLMLTTEGHDLLSLVKAADKKSGYRVAMNSLTGDEILKDTANVTLEKNKAGKYGFVISITDKKGNTTTYTISGEKAQTSRVATWFSQRLAKVDILAGDNRYETAVSVAREQLKMAPGLLGVTNTDTTIPSNIVLVNGKSLVDGLAAAPLAASLNAYDNASSKVAAPILLTEADGLPKATKSFLKELLADKKIGDVDTTIHLVGGTTVLSRELEKELRSYGFEIERYNGANREETSLEVAEKINNSKDAFVVGANGEADAMSIAAVAADKANSTTGTDVTPIIVAKKGGISYQALDELEGKDVTVVGGEASVSKEDYEAIEEATGKNGSVERVAGDNRQQTNAKILEKYYKVGKVQSVIVSKDGRGNNEELVDALTVANLAVQKKAPIVLAKSSLSAEQLNMVNLYGKSSDSLYQVGHGVDRDNVIKVLADRLGLTD